MYLKIVVVNKMDKLCNIYRYEEPRQLFCAFRVWEENEDSFPKVGADVFQVSW